MKKNIYIWKPIGLTPLDAVNKFKQKYPKYKNEIISYAGRLDPMAEGILILLLGTENKNRDKYLNLNKEYESEIIFGISTDTFDSLGLILDAKIKDIEKEEIEKRLSEFIGKQKQKYPPYSSKTVRGKPLYWWAHNKKIEEIDIPYREIEIFSINLLDYKKIRIRELVDNIVKDVKKIEGNFRQDKIIKSWKKFSKENSEKEITKIKIKISCSSGTYIRRIASDLGKDLNTGAFASSIKRIKIGDKDEKDCIRFLN